MVVRQGKALSISRRLPRLEKPSDKTRSGELSRIETCGCRSNRAQRKTPTAAGEGLMLQRRRPPRVGRPSGIKPLAVTYSCMAKPHYHRRMRVSLLSSGWDQVGPRRYGRQGRGRSSASRAGFNLGEALLKSPPWKAGFALREKDFASNKM